MTAPDLVNLSALIDDATQPPYAWLSGFSFFACLRWALGFSVRRSSRSGCLAASAAFSALAASARLTGFLGVRPFAGESGKNLGLRRGTGGWLMEPAIEDGGADLE